MNEGSPSSRRTWHIAMSASEVWTKLPMPPVAGSMKHTSELPMTKEPRCASCAEHHGREIRREAVDVMLPAMVIGVEAPPIGSVPTLTGTPARTAMMI